MMRKKVKEDEDVPQRQDQKEKVPRRRKFLIVSLTNLIKIFLKKNKTMMMMIMMKKNLKQRLKQKGKLHQPKVEVQVVLKEVTFPLFFFSFFFSILNRFSAWMTLFKCYFFMVITKKGLLSCYWSLSKIHL